MPTKYVRKRDRELRAALKGQDIEELFWWIVREHEQNLLDGKKSHLNPGLFRLSLESLARLHMKRQDKPQTADPAKATAELEQALRLLG